ncbi:MAG: hypothetical protein E7084_08455 [Bacteroidales bacterium]|nr:hypothetical protein [Bacteroidales bacterium]
MNDSKVDKNISTNLIIKYCLAIKILAVTLATVKNNDATAHIYAHTAQGEDMHSILLSSNSAIWPSLSHAYILHSRRKLDREVF